MDYIEKLKDRGYKFKGLNEVQIEKIEDYYKVKLPTDYKKFLRNLGADGDGFMIGSDCFYDTIFSLREYAEELLKDDNSDFILEKNHFVFHVHQGYIFMFIDLTFEENSPVYGYYEGDLEPSLKFNSLKAFYESSISDK
ncbi:SMI1/KNR4 family protein [Flavobacterium sp. NRK1]|uniref:SMI1/KNR4 family protein n=1 Tax=Flavobacterium sp. NRK1 TaxID=2954929 RepID=UPI00209294F2|nr:SMI1/KNR4 family protein [Flavobacterium sp. NRK1]MCO6148212.1 SMI1/KNR4 family protein [Flavobacterium sp. NRK1]